MGQCAIRLALNKTDLGSLEFPGRVFAVVSALWRARKSPAYSIARGYRVEEKTLEDEQVFLRKAQDSRCFVLEIVKHGVELGDLQ